MTGIQRTVYDSYLRATRWVLPPTAQDLLLRGGKRLFGTKFVFLACFPKSGSTLLSESLHALPGWRRLNSVPVDLTREQEPIRELIVRDWAAMRNNVVFKNHISHSGYLDDLIHTYRMHPYFLIRDLADVCCSLSDHFDRETTHWPFFSLNKSQLIFLDRDAVRLDFIVDLAIPWFINCYVSWMRYKDNGGPLQVIRYEDLTLDPHNVIRHVIESAGVGYSADEVSEAVELVQAAPIRSRLNVGVIGRGREFLDGNPRVEEMLNRYISYYPDIDFSPIYSKS